MASFLVRNYASWDSDRKRSGTGSDGVVCTSSCEVSMQWAGRN